MAIEAPPVPLRDPYPNNIQAEEALLGAMLVTPDAAGVGIEIIKDKEYFFKPANQIIFDAMKELYTRERNIDPLTLATLLESRGELELIGGEQALSKMRVNSPAPGHAKDYAEIVRDEYNRRSLIIAAEEVKDLVLQNRELDMRDLVDHAENIIYAATEDRLTLSTHKLKDLFEKALAKFEELYDSDESLTGASSGFTELDNILLGLQPQNLIVIGARPAIGKTSFALNMALKIAEADPVLFFSLEMGALELTKRIVSTLSTVPAKSLSTGNLKSKDWDNIAAAMNKFREVDLYIDDNPGLTVVEIKAKARRLKSELNNRLGAVFVDYMQLMNDPSINENRQVEVSSISRGLKVLARELNCPVIALSQLSRGVENRGDKKPMLADLRESGSIEQDADVVLFLYRDEVYNRQSESEGRVEVNVAKHRSGATGYFELAFRKEITRFNNLARANIPPEVTSFEENEQQI